MNIGSPAKVVLELRPSEVTWPAQAWVIAGSGADVWLKVLEEAGANLDECQGYILPASLRDRRPSGLLVLRGGGNLGGRSLPSVQGFRWLGSRLLIPCRSTLRPAITPEEADRMVTHFLAVFHPGAGLVGWEREERVEIGDLLSPWLATERNFSWARPGPEIHGRLHVIAASPVATLEMVEEGIGGRDVADLPPLPGEAEEESGVRRWRQRMKLRFLRALQRLGDQGEEGDEGGWRQRLQAWTEARVEALRRDQERELDRLLQLLRTDPDEGLQYALPLVRGPERPPPLRAGGSSSLPKRRLEFRLGGVSQRNMGTPWVVDGRRHDELARQYREAANRELRMGRHRRAAYIFVELLQDYGEAANVLRQGRHFREAAVLYLKHLGNPLEGAKCLRQGGFLQEALPIFESKKQYETVADIYREMGREQEAERFDRLEVARLLAHGATVRAANLVEVRLGAPLEAAKMLQAAWPNAGDAGPCLREELRLYERWNLPEAQKRRLEDLAADHPPGRALLLLEILVEAARQGREAECRALAVRCSWQVAGRWLGTPSKDGQSRRQVMDLLRRLHPEDWLLGRDTARFTALREEEERAATEDESDGGNGEDPLQRLQSTKLPNWVQWNLVHPLGRETCYLLGEAEGRIRLMRYRWDGAAQILALPGIRKVDWDRCRLQATAGALPEVVSVLGAGSVVPTCLTAVEAFPADVRVENPPWTEGEDFLGMTYGGRGVSWVLRRHSPDDDLLVLSSYSSMGDLIATHTLRLPFGPEPGALRAPVAMHYAQEQIVFVCGRHLVRFHRDRVESLMLSGEPRRLDVAQGGRLRLAVSYAWGLEVMEAGEEWGRRHRLEMALPDPVMAFTRTGELLAASPRRLDLFSCRDGLLEPMAWERLEEGDPPLALCQTETPHLYAVVGRQKVSLWRVTPWIKRGGK